MWARSGFILIIIVIIVVAIIIVVVVIRFLRMKRYHGMSD